MYFFNTERLCSKSGFITPKMPEKQGQKTEL